MIRHLEQGSPNFEEALYKAQVEEALAKWEAARPQKGEIPMPNDWPKDDDIPSR